MLAKMVQINPISVWFFPRASQRRVFLHLHVFTSSSHLLIFLSSYLQILTSSYLHIFSLSLSPSLSPSLSLCLLPSVTVPLLLFLVSLKSARSAKQAKRSGHPFAVRVAQNVFFSRLFLVRRQPFRTKRGSSVKNCSKIAILKCRNEVRVSKTAVKLRLWLVRQEPFRTKCSSSLKN